MAKTETEELRHIQLKKKMLDDYKDILQKHAAAVATFAVANDIELEEAVECALEILGYYGKCLLQDGIYDQMIELYNKGIEKLKGEKHEPEK